MQKNSAKSKKAKSPRGNYTEVLLEDMNSKLDVVAEGQLLLAEKVTQQLREITERVDEFEERVMLRFADVDQRFADVDQRFDVVDQELKTIKGELALINHNLKQKVDREEFKFLEARVARLEAAIKKNP